VHLVHRELQVEQDMQELKEREETQVHKVL
jgi:hypothetical protein